MTIGDVFARAWDLWRRDVGWLVLAGLVVGLIMVVIYAITFGIAASVFAGAAFTASSSGGASSSTNIGALGLGIGIAGVLLLVAASFFAEVMMMTFYGGLFEMVIGSYRQRSDVAFGDLFSGFRKFGSYALFALVLFGISFALGFLSFVPVIGTLIALCVEVWLAIVWLYVLPVIADHGMSFLEAAGKSNEMVKSAGWWWTFFKVLLLILAALVAVALIVVVARVVGHTNGTAGVATGIVLFLVFAVLFPPYAICYVSVLYVGSGGDIVTVPAGGGMGAHPPAPPAPPAYGEQPYGGQPYGATSYGPPASAPPAPPAGADAWRAAADPLASAPPPPPPLTPAGRAAPEAGRAIPEPAPPAPAVSGPDATAVTQAPASAPPAGEPDAPDPPAPPAPPAT